MPVPSSLALTDVPDGSQMIAAPVRNNYTSIETAVNDLIAFFGGGVLGSFLKFDGTDWKPTTGLLVDADVAAAAAIAVSKLAGYPADATKFLAGDGSWAVPPSAGAQLDYAQIIAPASSTATAAPGGTIITGNSIVFDGSRVKVEFFTPQFQPAGASSTFILWRDGSEVGRFEYDWASTSKFPLTLQTFDTPAAGAHTYKLTLFSNTGTNVVAAGAGGTGALVPAFLRVTKA